MARQIDQGAVGTIRVALNEEALAALVAGNLTLVKGITADGTVMIEILLSDIGWQTMRRLIDAAERHAGPGDRVVELSRRSGPARADPRS